MWKLNWTLHMCFVSPLSLIVSRKLLLLFTAALAGSTVSPVILFLPLNKPNWTQLRVLHGTCPYTVFTQSIYWGSAVSPAGGLYCFSVGVGGLSSWCATCYPAHTCNTLSDTVTWQHSWSFQEPGYLVAAGRRMRSVDRQKTTDVWQGDSIVLLLLLLFESKTILLYTL